MSASLALAEKDILVIDTDPQGNLTSGLGINRDSVQKSLYDVYAGRVPLEEVIIGTALPHLYLVPCTIDLLGAEVETWCKRKDVKGYLSNEIEKIRDRYRYVFIDCPPLTRDTTYLMALLPLIPCSYRYEVEVLCT